MSEWTNLPDQEPGDPSLATWANSVRDNPIAIAEGAAGAPRIAGQQGPAVLAGGLATGNNERDWVLARTASAAVGAVGTYAWLYDNEFRITNPGEARAGSQLRYAGVSLSANSGTTDGFFSGTAPAGTWRCMGYSRGGGAALGNSKGFTEWLRIS